MKVLVTSTTPTSLPKKKTSFLMASPSSSQFALAADLFGRFVDFDPKKAEHQWLALKNALSTAGARITIVESAWPGPVFISDSALVYGGTALVMRSERARSIYDAAIVEGWLREAGFACLRLPLGLHADAGDIIKLGAGRFLIGVRPGVSQETFAFLSAKLRTHRGAVIYPLVLAGQKYRHLDTVVGNLGNRALLIHQPGLAPVSRECLQQYLDLPMIAVSNEDSECFAVNAITVGDRVVTGLISDNLTAQIEEFGFEVVRVDLSEFQKLGGGASCLVLAC